jgi:hypothetical protein
MKTAPPALGPTASIAVRGPHRGDGVGVALRACYPACAALDDAFIALIAKIDRSSINYSGR